MRQVTVAPSPLAPGVYHALLDLNFRRLGSVFYRPQCDACAECRMIRVRVAEFRPSRAQRRCLEKNADVAVRIGPSEPTEEKHQLYRRYLERRHDGRMDGSYAEFVAFLHTSEVATIEIEYRLAGRLAGVGVADVEPRAMSAVYCYFNPDLGRRSIGVFNILTLIEASRRRGLPHLYLGFYVRGCGAMSYKARYRPCEILGADGRWTRFDLSSPGERASPDAPRRR